MLVRKLRIDRGWSQETLSELSGLSVRTIQRIERGGKASFESRAALASVLEVDATLLTEETTMQQSTQMTDEERDAIEYVRDIKGFYNHLTSYLISIAVMAVVNLIWTPDVLWFVWVALGWGVGIASHGLSVFEVFTLFGVEWEKRQIQKRLNRTRG